MTGIGARRTKDEHLDIDALLALVDASAAQLTVMAEQLADVAQELRARQDRKNEDPS
jgi:hypothetical protein